LIGTVNQAVPGKRKVDIGTMVQALVLDTLSGRSPLYMMKDFIKEQNCEVLLGREIDHELFNDAAVGRAMDAIYEAGTQQRDRQYRDVLWQQCVKCPLYLLGFQI